MKKLYLVLIIVGLFSGICSAQNLQEKSPLFPKKSSSKILTKDYVTTLGYCTDDIVTYVGLMEPATLAAAVEFDSDDLSGYVGNYITELSIAMNNSELITSGRVFIIENGGTNDANVVVEQNVNFSDEWNSITITTPYEITGEQIFIGYEVVVTGGRPLCTDAGPGNPKSRWVRVGGETEAWEDMIGVDIDKNFSIRAIVDTEGSFDEPIAGVFPLSYDAGNVILSQTETSTEFNITNIGVNTLTLNSATFTSAQWTSSINVAEVSLTAGESYSFTMSFTPNVTDFTVDTLVITTNGGDLLIPVYGQGIDDQECMPMNMELPGNLVLYEYPGGAGFVSGNNTYGHLAMAEYFQYPLLGEINFVMVPLGHVGGATGTIDFVVWEATAEGPGEVIHSKTVQMADIFAEFGGGNEVDIFNVVFDSPVQVNGDFFVGAILPTNGDDFAFLNSDMDLLPNTAWLQNADGVWLTSKQENGIALKNLMIPEVCPLGPVNSKDFIFNDVQIFPNPAKDFITVVNAENERLVVMNMLGSVVASIDNAKEIQKIDVSNLANGTYFVKTNNQVKKIIIIK